MRAKARGVCVCTRYLRIAHLLLERPVVEVARHGEAGLDARLGHAVVAQQEEARRGERHANLIGHLCRIRNVFSRQDVH